MIHITISSGRCSGCSGYCLSWHDYHKPHDKEDYCTDDARKPNHGASNAEPKAPAGTRLPRIVQLLVQTHNSKNKNLQESTF